MYYTKKKENILKKPNCNAKGIYMNNMTKISR